MAELLALPIGAYNVRDADYMLTTMELSRLGALVGCIVNQRFVTQTWKSEGALPFDPQTTGDITIVLTGADEIDLQFAHLGLFLPEPRRIRVLNLGYGSLYKIVLMPEMTQARCAELTETLLRYDQPSNKEEMLERIYWHLASKPKRPC